MRLALFVLVAAAGALASGCSPELHYTCHRGWTVGHPTMTPEELNLGPDARVRQISEGSKGGLGGGATKGLD